VDVRVTVLCSPWDPGLQQHQQLPTNLVLHAYRRKIALNEYSTNSLPQGRETELGQEVGLSLESGLDNLGVRDTHSISVRSLLCRARPTNVRLVGVASRLPVLSSMLLSP
jgi:hypothetical protein